MISYELRNKPPTDYRGKTVYLNWISKIKVFINCNACLIAKKLIIRYYHLKKNKNT
jgi:hypothetical protein